MWQRLGDLFAFWSPETGHIDIRDTARELYMLLTVCTFVARRPDAASRSA